MLTRTIAIASSISIEIARYRSIYIPCIDLDIARYRYRFDIDRDRDRELERCACENSAGEYRMLIFTRFSALHRDQLRLCCTSTCGADIGRYAHAYDRELTVPVHVALDIGKYAHAYAYDRELALELELSFSVCHKSPRYLPPK